jgi:hypothetical protein
MNSFPNLGPVDGNAAINLKAQSHSPAGNPEHRDLEQPMEAIGPPDYHRFPVFSRQD